jgi:hypothetical protein
LTVGRAGKRVGEPFARSQEALVRTTPRRLLGGAFAATLFLTAACGDDGADGEDAPAGTTAAEDTGTTTDQSDLPPEGADQNVTDDTTVADTSPTPGAPEGAPTPEEGDGPVQSPGP